MSASVAGVGLVVATVLAGLTIVPAAKAQSAGGDGGEAALGLAAASVGGMVTSLGAATTTASNEATPGWTRSSLGFGGVNLGLGAIFAVVGAVVDDEEALPFLIVGASEGAIGLAGLVAGAFSYAALPPEDDGIPAPSRPRPAARLPLLRGSF